MWSKKRKWICSKVELNAENAKRIGISTHTVLWFPLVGFFSLQFGRQFLKYISAISSYIFLVIESWLELAFMLIVLQIFSLINNKCNI